MSEQQRQHLSALVDGEIDPTLAQATVSALRADTQIQAVYPHRKHLSAKVRQFIDHLAEHCGPRPYWDEGLPI